MATPRKAREFVVATEMEANYSLIVEAMMGNLALDQMIRGDKKGVLITKVSAALIERLRSTLIDALMKIIAEQFSDDELDQLIVNYRLPVHAKLRALFPEITQDVTAMFSDGRIDIQTMVKEFIEEYK